MSRQCVYLDTLSDFMSHRSHCAETYLCEGEEQDEGHLLEQRRRIAGVSNTNHGLSTQHRETHRQNDKHRAKHRHTESSAHTQGATEKNAPHREAERQREAEANNVSGEGFGRQQASLLPLSTTCVAA